MALSSGNRARGSEVEKLAQHSFRRMVLDGTIKSVVELRNGMIVHVRPIRLDDAKRLQLFYSHLSPTSAFFRFLACWKELSSEQAEYLAHVDYETQMALVATLGCIEPEQIIGIASYAGIGPRENVEAEGAVVIVDQYQGMGLGTILLECLATYARTKGIRTFVGTVHVDNAPMLRWLKQSGLEIETNELADGASDLQVRIALG